jgi:lipopolysaccharide biosynthesis protein
MNELRRYVQPGPFYEDDSAKFDLDGNPVRVLAYYLPQFHSIPENDLWWGKGFTEWTNVTKSFPRFRGHYQPHLPGELGFYNLRDPEVLYRQAALARRYGVHGFCIHHYWFNGKALLDEPLRLLLENADIKIGFCLNWANENWSRRWDGFDQEILIAQQYAPEDDLAFAASLERSLADPRYIRINGRPLLMIYRPAQMPDARATADRLRSHFTRAGYGNPYLVMPETANSSDVLQFGMDAAAGFPPHRCGFESRRPIQAYLARLAHPGYRGSVKSYDVMMRNALSYLHDSVPDRAPASPFFPGVCPGWDSHARRTNGGVVFYGSTPEKYGRWLKEACEYTIRQNPPEERIVFVNAWNEWAEGAHLEPDRYFGYAFLAETGRVLSRLANESGGHQRNETTLQANARAGV